MTALMDLWNDFRSTRSAPLGGLDQQAIAEVVVAGCLGKPDLDQLL